MRAATRPLVTSPSMVGRVSRRLVCWISEVGLSGFCGRATAGVAGSAGVPVLLRAGRSTSHADSDATVATATTSNEYLIPATPESLDPAHPPRRRPARRGRGL